MLVIGHRGAAGLERENTVGSLKKAEEWGVDMVEMDLRSRNGEIVASHGKAGSIGASLAEVLKESHLPLNFEVKEPGFEAELLEALKSFSSRVLISSKRIKVLEKIRALDENIQIGLVLGSANFFLVPFLRRLDKKLNFYSIHPKRFLVKNFTLRYFRKLGKRVFVWTINDPKEYESFRKLNLDGVFTDRPDLIKK